ncbi:MAG: DMT family transporter [Crenarchaeota archaeon]|nr:DMT family transporter [Thermoproteota archaeon]
MLNILPALTTCLIWSLSIVLYKKFSRDIPVIIINIFRLLSASTVLAVLCLILRFTLWNIGIIYAALSGILALSVGDTAYIYSSSIIGVSTAAPIAYLYVILVQFLAIMYGETITVGKIVAAFLAVLSIFLITSVKNREAVSRRRIAGIVLALVTCLAWSFGQVVLKPATYFLNPLEITFIRSLAGLVTLSILYPSLPMKLKYSNHIKEGIPPKVILYISLIGALDLALGSYLFVYSIASIGVDYTVIITGTIPVFAQLFANIVEKERLTLRHVLSSILVTLGIIIVTLC